MTQEGDAVAGGQVTIQRFDGEQAAAQLDAILPVYEEVYAEPPYNEGPRDVADFIDRFRVQARRPGVRAATARTDGGALVGFGFGYLLGADTTWWDGALEPLPEQFTRETGDRTLVIIELAVRRPWRRRGVAARLHTALLDGLTIERITLTMRPDPEAEPAQRAYAAWGYRRVARTQPWDDAPIYDLMVRDLA